MDDQRIEIASRILAGFAANPNVFSSRITDSHPRCQSDVALINYALSLADKLVEAHKRERP